MQNYLHLYTSKDAGITPMGSWVLDFILVVFLAYCAFTDGTRAKIYNHATFPAMLAGLLLHFIFGGASGLLWSFTGLGLGFVLVVMPFILELAKAGDLKLLMAIGALKGWAFCGFGFLYGAIAFGLIAVPMLWRKNELAEVGETVKGYVAVATTIQGAPEAPARVSKRKYLPWGVGLCLGYFVALILELAFGHPFWFQPFW